VSVRALAVFLAVLAVIGLLGYGLLSKSAESLAVGDQVPAPELPKLEGSGTASLDDYRGQWVLVNVWASWCQPCRDEIPALESYYESHRGKGLVVLGVDTQDNSSDGLGFVRQYEVSYPQLRDGDGSYGDDLGTTGVPESFLVDPHGHLALHEPGPFTDKTLKLRVDPLLRGRE